MNDELKDSGEMPSPPVGRSVGLKICGQKRNIAEVASLRPDYLGFIFWEKSSRYFGDQIPELPPGIQKVGVFVNAKQEDIIKKVSSHRLDLVQLHGSETPHFCQQLTSAGITIIKVFSIGDGFDFSILEPYEPVCDYFLFDTKGKLPGGNGYAFNWELLKAYPSAKPYFLSGGIGLENSDALLSFLKSPEAKNCHAIDINSRFEVGPGLKDMGTLVEFMDKVGIGEKKFRH